MLLLLLVVVVAVSAVVGPRLCLLRLSLHYLLDFALCLCSLLVLMLLRMIGLACLRVVRGVEGFARLLIFPF